MRHSALASPGVTNTASRSGRGVPSGHAPQAVSKWAMPARACTRGSVWMRAASVLTDCKRQPAAGKLANLHAHVRPLERPHDRMQGPRRALHALRLAGSDDAVLAPVEELPEALQNPAHVAPVHGGVHCVRQVLLQTRTGHAHAHGGALCGAGGHARWLGAPPPRRHLGARLGRRREGRRRWRGGGVRELRATAARDREVREHLPHRHSRRWARVRAPGRGPELQVEISTVWPEWLKGADPRTHSQRNMSSKRRAGHAGSWYSSNGAELDGQLTK